MAEIKFTELLEISNEALSDADVFAISDVSEGTSHKYTFGDLKSKVLGESILGNNPNITDLNSLITNLNSSLPNNLYATRLWTGSTYEPGSHFLNYNNLNNKPTIPVDLVDLTNTNGYLRYNSSTNSIVWADEGVGVGSARLQITTDNIPEGFNTNSNKYYTEARVESYLEQNFSRFLSERSLSFDEGNVIDSVVGVDGTFQNVVSAQSNQILVSDSSLLNNFRSGDVLRIYGASTDQDLDEIAEFTDYSATVSKVGFGTGEATVTLEYTTCVYDYVTGKVTEPLFAGSIGISPAPPSTDAIQSFSSSNFINLTFNGIPEGKSVIVYRKQSTDQNYKLVAVLGPKEISAGIWVDYYTFDYTIWSGKDAADNSFLEDNLIHFPLIPSSTPRRGWADTLIAENGIRNNGNGTFTITLEDFLYVNLDGACQICHNDTVKIQSAIDTNSASGLKSVRLNAKTYVSERLTIPSGFGIEGTPSISKIVRLPWAGGTAVDSKMIRAQSTANANGITLSGFDLDGNMPNQILFDDSTESNRNYAIDFGETANDIIIDKVRVKNIIGGGIYIDKPSEFKINTSEVRNSGMSDRPANLFSPLIAGGGQQVLLTTSIFENFTDYVDVSLTDKGMITSNIISNCGSGLFIYGSRFFVSSQNILTGPNNEFLPNPDIYNSVYDSVNINIELNSEFVSDVYKYQENGVDFDFTQNARNNIQYELFKLRKSSISGQETLYEEITGIPIENISDANVLPSEGAFQFRILQSGVNDLINNYNYDAMIALDSDHVGLVYRASLEEYVPAGNFSGTTMSLLPNGNVQFIVPEPKYLSVGANIVMNRTSFSSTQTIGTIINLSSTANTTAVTVEANFGTVSELGSDDGSINIVNKFTLAQGRILQ